MANDCLPFARIRGILRFRLAAAVAAFLAVQAAPSIAYAANYALLIGVSNYTFKDITPLLGDPAGFREAVDLLSKPFAGKGVARVAGIESRGFLLATAIAYQLGAGVVPLRKKGKLPRRTVSASYALEYGTDALEAHADAVEPGSPVLLQFLIVLLKHLLALIYFCLRALQRFGGTLRATGIGLSRGGLCLLSRCGRLCSN